MFCSRGPISLLRLAKRMRMRSVRVFSSVPAVPEECAEEPTNCCGSGCDPCVWEKYHNDLKKYQCELFEWEDQNGVSVKLEPKIAADQNSGLEPGDRALLRNFKTRRLLHMNGVAVDILCQDDLDNTDVRRWRVRPVGGNRVLRLPAERLTLFRIAAGRVV